jgi:hypothetical protein
MNDDQFNEKLVLPTTLSDQGDSDKKMQISHKQHTLLQSNKRKKTKNTKGRRKRLDHMTSKNQMRRVTDFICPSLEFPLSRIGEEKTTDRFQALNSKNSKIMKKGIKYEQKGVYFSRGSMLKVKGRIIESQSSSTSEETGSGPPKNAIFEEILGKKWLALWYKGHQSVINIYLTLPGSAGTFLTWAGGFQAQKTHKNVKKPKILIKF